jgi:hypothetical protein
MFAAFVSVSVEIEIGCLGRWAENGLKILPIKSRVHVDVFFVKPQDFLVILFRATNKTSLAHYRTPPRNSSIGVHADALNIASSIVSSHRTPQAGCKSAETCPVIVSRGYGNSSMGATPGGTLPDGHVIVRSVHSGFWRGFCLLHAKFEWFVRRGAGWQGISFSR